MRHFSCATLNFVVLAVDYAMLSGNEALVEDLTNGFGSCSRGFTLQRVTNPKLFAAGAIKNSLLLENRYSDSQQIERPVNIDEENTTSLISGNLGALTDNENAVLERKREETNSVKELEWLLKCMLL
jgi:hypothetical protein